MKIFWYLRFSGEYNGRCHGFLPLRCAFITKWFPMCFQVFDFNASVLGPCLRFWHFDTPIPIGDTHSFKYRRWFWDTEHRLLVRLEIRCLVYNIFRQQRLDFPLFAVPQTLLGKRAKYCNTTSHKIKCTSRTVERRKCHYFPSIASEVTHLRRYGISYWRLYHKRTFNANSTTAGIFILGIICTIIRNGKSAVTGWSNVNKKNSIYTCKNRHCLSSE